MWICQVFDWVNSNSGFLQALFTLGLVIATVGLLIATEGYRRATKRYAGATDRMKRMQQISSVEKLLVDYTRTLVGKGFIGGQWDKVIIGIREEDPDDVKTQKREEFKKKVLKAYGKLVEELLEDISKGHS